MLKDQILRICSSFNEAGATAADEASAGAALAIARRILYVATAVITPGVVTLIEVKIRKVGNSLGAVLPREALAKLRVEEGDRLFLTETPDGYRITPYDPEFERQMALAETGMAQYRNTLRALAK